MTRNKSKTSMVIRVDVEVYEALGRKNRGFECANDVLRRVLGLPPKTTRRPRKGAGRAH